MSAGPSAVVVGGGPVGAAFGLVLRRRGAFERVVLVERFSDLRLQPLNARRSINLVLGTRGLRLADELGLKDQLLQNTVPVTGRMIHHADGGRHYQPYGLEHECNYAINRGELNAFWLTAASEAGVELRFNRQVTDFDLDTGKVLTVPVSDEGTLDAQLNWTVRSCQNEAAAEEVFDRCGLVLGCDGAGSRVRQQLHDAGVVAEAPDFITWGYKEVMMAKELSLGLDQHALHIWPRHDHFLMALPNPDGSFTGTMYMEHDATRPDGSSPDLTGAPTFQSVCASEGVALQFLRQHYATALPHLGDAGIDEFQRHPVGLLGNVRAEPYHAEGASALALLAGDAAHAVVPFFGQGVQCGLEDAAVLNDILIKRDTNLSHAVEEYSFKRVRSCHALRELALENMVEMGDKVGQPRFQLRKALEAELERAFPHKYRSRYALVSYTHNDYADVLALGKVQDRVLDELLEGVSDVTQVDMAQAEALVESVVVSEAVRRGMAY